MKGALGMELNKSEKTELVKDYLAFIFLKTGIEPSADILKVLKGLKQEGYITEEESGFLIK